MRGVLSEAMVMCASTPEKVELIVPPEGSIPGDRITFEGYEGFCDYYFIDGISYCCLV